MTDSDSDLICQFSLAGLPVDDKLPALIRQGLCDSVGADKISIVQLKPRKWARNAIIKCVDVTTKQKLLCDGIRIGDRKFDFLDGGSGSMRISVDDAPLDMPHSVISDALSRYGSVSGYRDQSFYVGEERTDWFSGTRVFFMKQVKETIPPTMDIVFNGFTEKISIRYDGQSLYECRFCNQHVERGSHSCDKKPVKRCFNCDSPDHMNFQCKKAKLCRKCSSPNHLARDCKSNEAALRQKPRTNVRRPPKITLGELPVAPPRKRKRNSTAQSSGESVRAGPAGETSGPADTNPVGPGGAAAGPVGPRAQMSPSPESVIDSAADHIQEINHQLEVCRVKGILMGDSNSYNLPLNGDDDLQLHLHKITLGGLKIKEAQIKFEDLPDDVGLAEKTAVVTHVGSCNFPLAYGCDVKQLYNDYVQLLETVNRKCPNARVYISGIPPRRGDLTTKVNRDIRRLNRLLESLADSEDELTFINNWIFLSDEKFTLNQRMIFIWSFRGSTD